MRHGPWRMSRTPRVLDPGRAVRAARGRPRDCRSRPRPSRWHRIVRRAKAGAAYAFEALEDRADTASPKGAARGTPRDAGRRGGDHRRAVTNLNATPSIPPGMCPNVAWCPRSASAQANRADAQVPRCTGPASTIAYACRRLRATRRVRRAVAPAVSGRPGPLIECRLPWAPVAQLDRVPGFEPGGRGFESLRARQSCHKIQCLNRHAATQRRASRLRDCDAGVGKTPTLPAANDVWNRTTLQRGHCAKCPWSGRKAVSPTIRLTRRRFSRSAWANEGSGRSPLQGWSANTNRRTACVHYGILKPVCISLRGKFS